MADSHETYPAGVPFDADFIKNRTGFTLAVMFPSFAEEFGDVNPDVHEERERLASELGESHVLTSFFLEKGIVHLGLFVRRLPYDAYSRAYPVDAMSAEIKLPQKMLGQDTESDYDH